MSKFNGGLVALALMVSVSAPAFARGGGSHSSGGESYRGYLSGTGANTSSHAVGGYTRRDGIYVAPSHATNPNGTQTDNYGAKGNLNPYDERTGTRYVPN